MEAGEDASEEDEIETATMLKGDGDQHEDDVDEIMAVETINVMSANGASRPIILKRNAALQCLQELCLGEEMQGAFKKEAREASKTFIGAPTDPEKQRRLPGLDSWQ